MNTMSVKFKALFFLILLTFISSGRLKAQESGAVLEQEIKLLSAKLDSITEGKLGRSAFLDRGFESSKKHNEYDSIEMRLTNKIKQYLKTPLSLKNAEALIGNTYTILKAEGIRIYQREYVSGGSQEEYRKLVQYISDEGITLRESQGYWTNQLFAVNGKYLEFQSWKGCTTCCAQRIVFDGKVIYSLDYRCSYIEDMFSYDAKEKVITIVHDDLFVEAENEEGYEKLNDTITLRYVGYGFK